MKPVHNIDAVLLDVYSLMPSSGTWPFTMMRLPPAQVLVLERTDFDAADLMDYAQHTKEYAGISPDDRNAYLEAYRVIAQHPLDITEWRARITKLGIGVLAQLGRKKGLCFKPVTANLSDLDTQWALQAKRLKAYQLFDVLPIHPDGHFPKKEAVSIE